MINESAELVYDLSAGEPGFVAEIKAMGGEALLDCIQCGKCAAVCPMALAGFPIFNKKLIQAIFLGAREILLEDSSIWACQSCNRCTEICPRDVRPFEIILAMRRVAVREFAVPALSIEGLKSLYDVGHAVYLKDSGQTRQKVGLPEKPSTVLASPEALKEIKAILHQTDLWEIGLIPMDGNEMADASEV